MNDGIEALQSIASAVMPNRKALEELERLDRHIAICGQRIAEQRRRIASIKMWGWDTEDSESLLRNLINSLRALDQLRETVRKEVDEPER
jgi:hypothetical protein